MTPTLAMIHLNWQAIIEDGVELALVGMLVVFFALSVTSLVIAGLRRLDEWMSARSAQAVVSKDKAAVPEAAPIGPRIDDHLIVVLAAAASTVLQKSVRVHRVRFLGPSDRGESWKQEGRSVIMTSHRPRPRGR
ncbi:MAG: hypothetical protein GC164_02660 [Phycisphaera sp.]|nr:hypothetical protein [Phycisphaera sp.]